SCTRAHTNGSKRAERLWTTSGLARHSPSERCVLRLLLCQPDTAASPIAELRGLSQDAPDPTVVERRVARPPEHRTLSSAAKIAIPPHNAALDIGGGAERSARSNRCR